MEKDQKLSRLYVMMLVLNLGIVVFYCLLCTVTTLRICDSFGAYAFLNEARLLPPHVWQMPAQSLGLYLVLCVISVGKQRLALEDLGRRVVICVAEIVLCVGLISSLSFYYSGFALLVMADLVQYVQRSHLRLGFIVVLVLVYAFGQFETVALVVPAIPFRTYLEYYGPFARGFFSGVETVLICGNILLFVLDMIVLFTGERAENRRIRRLNEQLNAANVQLRDYAVELERMTEIRERNRLAREIHDTLGHTLTGIIMGADAALALFTPAPEEARKRVQVIAESAREGLTDVRRSIRALRADALEQNSLEDALEKMMEKYRVSTDVEICYMQKGTLDLAQDEEDLVYRVVQESMTNSVRHGHAERIEVSITREEGVLHLSVQDDGEGASQVEEGFGLRHMRERLDMLGGTMSFGGRSDLPGGRGFFVEVCMPIRKREASE